jgi:hypothetical protein
MKSQMPAPRAMQGGMLSPALSLSSPSNKQLGLPPALANMQQQHVHTGGGGGAVQVEFSLPIA